MPSIPDFYVLSFLGFGQIVLLIRALIQLAAIKARQEDHSRRLDQLEETLR